MTPHFPQPVRTLRTASHQCPRVLLPAPGSAVPWLPTPSPRSTAGASESEFSLLHCRIPSRTGLSDKRSARLTDLCPTQTSAGEGGTDVCPSSAEMFAGRLKRVFVPLLRGHCSSPQPGNRFCVLLLAQTDRTIVVQILSVLTQTCQNRHPLEVNSAQTSQQNHHQSLNGSQEVGLNCFLYKHS